MRETRVRFTFYIIDAKYPIQMFISYLQNSVEEID